MDENLELLEYVYQNSEMGVYTLTKLINKLNGKDNKIKKHVEEALKEYEKYVKTSKKLIKKYGLIPKENGFMSKFSAGMGIMFETMKDNSDAAIAHMITQGVTMGIVDISTKINNYKKSVNNDILKIATDFLKFSQNEVEKLKEYL